MCALFIFATPDQVNDGSFMCQVACNTTQIEPTPGVARVRRALALSTDIVANAEYTIHILAARTRANTNFLFRLRCMPPKSGDCYIFFICQRILRFPTSNKLKPT